MKYVIVALVFAFSATEADAHYPAHVHHARYKHHPPAYPEDYAAPDSLGLAGDVGVVYRWDACQWVWYERRCW
jgi:hypothetical protein